MVNWLPNWLMTVPPEPMALAALFLAGVAEWMHRTRLRRLSPLAFGPGGRPRAWTAAVPALRTVAVGLLVWGLINLCQLTPRLHKAAADESGVRRHILIALDVSPSMQLKDGGPLGQQTRAQRAGELLLSVLDRIALEQARVTIVAFYTGAKPVVVDTSDLYVVKNILNDLPLDQAFEPGRTELLEGIRETFDLAARWPKDSTTFILVSDGDTVPDTGMPPRPSSIERVLVVGVGDARAGKFIDGHQSRQDGATLRQVATRLGGVYHDGNQKHLPSPYLAELMESLPVKSEFRTDRRVLSLGAVLVGAILLTGLSFALALGGSRWQTARYAGARRPARWEKASVPRPSNYA